VATRNAPAPSSVRVSPIVRVHAVSAGTNRFGAHAAMPKTTSGTRQRRSPANQFGWYSTMARRATPKSSASSRRCVAVTEVENGSSVTTDMIRSPSTTPTLASPMGISSFVWRNPRAATTRGRAR